MQTINVNNPPAILTLGQAGENAFRPVRIDWSAWQEAYPNGTFSIVIARPDGQAYPAVTGISETPYTWAPNATDTAVNGKDCSNCALTITAP